MDLKRLPSELVQEILDRVPFLEWLTSLTLVCKEWLQKCLKSTSNKSFPITHAMMQKAHVVKLSTIRDIVARYQVSGLDISILNHFLFKKKSVVDVPWAEVVTASKRLKWLVINVYNVADIVTASFDSIERLSITDHYWGQFLDEAQFPMRKFLEKFPKVRTFSMRTVHSCYFDPPNWNFKNAPPNTEILCTGYYYLPETIYPYLDNLTRDLPHLKKLILTFTNELPKVKASEIYTQLENYMQTTHKIKLVVRDPLVFVHQLDQFIEAYNKNGLPYDYYILPVAADLVNQVNYTLFCHACTEESLDVMKYLIDSRITTLEKELQLYPLPLPAHEITHRNSYFRAEYHPFLLPIEKFRNLTDTRKEILDYFISLGFTCAAKGKDGKKMFQAFGTVHPAIEYVALRSPPEAAASTILGMMEMKPEQYRVYFDLYYKSSKEVQEMTRQLLKDFDFSNVLYYVIESRDLQIIDKFLEEFGVDLNRYADAVNECPAMEECDDVGLYINSRLNN